MSEAAPAWIAELPEDLRTNPSLTTFKTIGDLAKSHVELRSHVGRKEDELFPKDDWKPEQWTAFHKRLGVPEKPDGYPAVDDAMAEKAGLSKEVLGAAMAKMHSLGLTPRQVKGIVHDWYLQDAIKGTELQAQQQKEAHEKTIGELKRKYGDAYDAKVGLVKSVLKLGGGDLADRIANAGFGDDPQMFDALVALGSKVMESSSGGAGKLGDGSSPEVALREINTIKQQRIANPTVDAAYNDPKSSEHKRWKELHALAYPEKS